MFYTVQESIPTLTLENLKILERNCNSSAKSNANFESSLVRLRNRNRDSVQEGNIFFKTFTIHAKTKLHHVLRKWGWKR